MSRIFEHFAMIEETANKAKSQIERYREKKNNDMFDDFYNCELDFMEACMEYYLRQHKPIGYEKPVKKPITKTEFEDLF